MDPQVYEVLSGIHQTFKKSGGKLTETEVAYITGALESVLVIFRQPTEETFEDNGIVKKLFRG